MAINASAPLCLAWAPFCPAHGAGSLWIRLFTLCTGDSLCGRSGVKRTVTHDASWREHNEHQYRPAIC